MQVKNQSYIHNKQISFGAQRLFPIKLQRILADGTTSELDGFFSKFDDNDEELVKKLLKIWNRRKYGNFILSKFLHRKNLINNLSKDDYYLIECPQLGNNEKSVVALAQTSTYKDTIYLHLLQSAGEHLPDQKIKWAGCGVIYGIVKIAQDIKTKTINLTASSQKSAQWYKSLMFQQDNPRNASFTLRANKFSKLESSIAQKFNIKG